MGKEGKYVLKLAEATQLSETDTEMESDEEIFELLVEQDVTSHPSKMIKQVCVQLMRCLTIGAVLHADKMQPTAVRHCTSILRQVYRT